VAVSAFWGHETGRARSSSHRALVQAGLYRCQAICPTRGDEAVVAIRLPYDHGMMHPVHIGCHDKKPEDPIHLFGNVNVAVVEHRCGVKGHLKDEDSQGRGPERSNGRELDAHGDDDFDGVEAHSRGHIKIEIHVMHHVQSPKNRPHIFCVQRCRNRSVGPLERDVHQCSVLSLKSVLSETLVVISKRPR